MNFKCHSKKDGRNVIEMPTTGGGAWPTNSLLVCMAAHMVCAHTRQCRHCCHVVAVQLMLSPHPAGLVLDVRVAVMRSCHCLSILIKIFNKL